MPNKEDYSDISCHNCTYRSPRIGCTATTCPFFSQRLRAGLIGYRDAISHTFPHHQSTSYRMQRLVRFFPGTMWRDEGHQRRFLQMLSFCNAVFATPAYQAALYLLTADENLYQNSSRCFLRNGLTLRYMEKHSMTPDEYTLYAYAKKIYSGENEFPSAELDEVWEASPCMFPYIINAIMIAQHSGAVLEITQAIIKKK